MMFNNSDEWIAYCQTVHPRGMDLGLQRITQVADHLQLRHFDIPVITVAGTNGKGSTVAMLSAIYLANGYRVASYTSPHILNFHERYQINGAPISDQMVVQAFAVIEQGRRASGVTLTYFEYAVLIALYVFQQLPLDVIILEVGLGGRLDATNIVDCDCAVITNIDFDHEAILGYTREAIGYEKAGILRHNRPVIFGDPRPVQAIMNKATQLHAPYYAMGEAFSYESDEMSWTFSNVDISYAELPIPGLPLVNASIALQTVHVMQAVLPIEAATLGPVFAQISLAGRWQAYPNPLCGIRLDVAHNPQSAAYLAELCERNPVEGKTIAVCSILADKNQQAMLSALRSTFFSWYIAPLAVERGTVLPDFLQQFALAKIETVFGFPDVAAALTAALAAAEEKDRIICFGSFYTVAEALNTLQKRCYTRQQITAEDYHHG